MFAVNGILFNHESPRRGETFVTRKITRAVGGIKRGQAGRTCTWATSTRSATGATRPSTSRACGGCCRPTSPTTTCWPPASATPFASSCEIAFDACSLNWQDYVKFDERYLRPTEVDALIGDAGKARDRSSAGCPP